MRKIKILYVVTTLGLGGVQEHLRLLVKYLDKERFDIWIAYGPPADKRATFEAMGVSLVDIGLIKAINPIRDLKAFFALWRLMRRERFDIVHVHMTKAGILGRLAAKLTGARAVLMTGHGWSGHLEHYFTHPAAKKGFYLIEWFWGRFFTDGLILLTRGDFDAIQGKNMYPKTRLFLVPNGIDASDLERATHPVPIREELSFHPSDKIVIMVGRICKVKATWVYAQAAVKVQESRNDVKFLLIGEGPEAETVRQITSKAGAKGSFHMLGLRRDVPAIMKEADIFVLTSITEGMAMTLLEAMALGLPVVATDIPGNRTLVKNGETGLLVRVNDPAAVADSLIKLLDDARLRRSLGSNAKKFIRENFSFSKMGEKTTEIYEKILEEKAGPSAATMHPGPTVKGEQDV